MNEIYHDPSLPWSYENRKPSDFGAILWQWSKRSHFKTIEIYLHRYNIFIHNLFRLQQHETYIPWVIAGGDTQEVVGKDTWGCVVPGRFGGGGGGASIPTTGVVTFK